MVAVIIIIIIIIAGVVFAVVVLVLVAVVVVVVAVAASVECGCDVAEIVIYTLPLILIPANCPRRCRDSPRTARKKISSERT